MSHLRVKKVAGKYKIFDKNKKAFKKGTPIADKDKADSMAKKQDKLEDKKK
jgi:hypothetical protein